MHKPIIDYEIAAMFTPSVFLGTIFGVLLNIFLPKQIISLIFVLLQLYLFKSTLKNGIKLYKEEVKPLEE